MCPTYPLSFIMHRNDYSDVACMNIPASLLQMENQTATSVREYWYSLGVGAACMDRSEPTDPTQRVHWGREVRPPTRGRGVQRAQGASKRGVLRVLTRGAGAGRVLGSAASAHRRITDPRWTEPSCDITIPTPSLAITITEHRQRRTCYS